VRHRIVVGEGAGERLDVFLASRIEGLSRTRAAQLAAEGRVRVDGRAARKSHRPAAGEVIEVEVPVAVAPERLRAEPIALTIVHQDADLAVIDKPAGMVVHPSPGHATGTLVHALLHHLGDLSGIGGELRPGIVHRLDRDTSGLMLVAKHDRAHRALSDALRRREIRRVYLAAAWGHLGDEERLVDAPIGRSPTDRKRMAVLPDGRTARTRFRRLERWQAADLLRVELETGRTHQIRVHLAHVGHPVVGDPVYGGGGARGISGPARAWARALEKRTGRQFLHAAGLSLRHPTTGEALEFEAALPPELETIARWARESSGIG
jgi:23S rRNA pseudouridine1911/1915/1917 synthase